MLDNRVNTHWQRRCTLADPLVLYDVEDKVSIITLNRPDKLNAISHELQQALTETFEHADADPATCVVIIARGGSQLLRRLRHWRQGS